MDRAYGIDGCMRTTSHHAVPTKKVTMNLPVDLVEGAAKYLGKASLTEAVREALRNEMHRKGCQELLAMRGKIKLDIDLKALRQDD